MADALPPKVVTLQWRHLQVVASIANWTTCCCLRHWPGALSPLHKWPPVKSVTWTDNDSH